LKYEFLEIGREGALAPLVVPLFDPSHGAQGDEVLHEELAGLVLFTFQIGATVEVNIVLPAVPENIKLHR
jgi:hypothetical protein